MKKFLVILLCMVCAHMAQASHIIGGQVYYKYLGTNGTNLKYSITLKLYRICGDGERIAKMPTAVYLSAFDKSDYRRTGQYLITQTAFEVKDQAKIDPCIVNPPVICYQMGTYTTNIELPANAEGYTIAFQSCCRDPYMENIIAEPIPGGRPGDLGTGATYFADIPGSTIGYPNNSSPVFNKEEATLVCSDKKFTYDFSATDPDNDELTYEFCDAYKGGLTSDGQVPPPAFAPPYNYVQYKSPFSGGSPLGLTVTIDPKTGIISGTAPAAGKYVVTVCVHESRNGKRIGTLRKDFHINITSCVKQVTAAMPEKYADCSSLTVTFTNNSTLGKPYYWDFGDGNIKETTSAEPFQYTYAREGTYTVKLYVDKTSNCGDSATAIVYAYPVFKPDFTSAGACINKETKFNAITPTRSDAGAVVYHKWEFGDGDTSNLAGNLSHTYTTPGTYDVKLYARNAKGCEQTVTHPITIYANPPFTATNDTLLCAKDSLHMRAGSTLTGTYAWTPANYFILRPNTPDPIVFPPKSATYKVVFTDSQGCTNSKDIKVDVRDTIHVRTIADSTVCTSDQVHLPSYSDGLYAYRWIELSTGQVVSQTPDAYVTPAPPRQSYAIEVSLGKCRSADTVSLKVVDPPKATAAPDTTLCFGVPVTLRATGGAYYRWTPAYYVDKSSSPVTLAHPVDTTLFTVTVTDTLGCPKPVTATALVKVVPKVNAFAGNDTIIMLNTPFQMNATGGVRYTWSPPDGLNSRNIYNPVTTYNHDITYTVTAYTQEGCTGTDDIFVRFIKGPDIYIPNAFSPNGDGLNDVFRPLPVGIVQIEFFRVFDRWGKLMYSTTTYMKGWDGTVNGNIAAVGTYVWVVQGKDINNETVQRKGTVTLVR
ncbi:PKD domain-containing protein [Chitinophaga arvensicola]|uniref:Gliding motility-associated C-terminal domain-containing protein n=1 Tax=Chitinophaga arvensicola TaxID=29529 RepID=A0A1I0QS49_9BACT|nr:PKD domain-containing protein [Chitinophaga arvensicola]SEW30175.1 gliding motility-associated C-terminal domain-containing protein [Chitinophaga arvensicola]